MARIFITGGAGFIGSNLASRLIKENHRVTIFDNLSRSGCETNIKCLKEIYGDNSFKLIIGDVRDFQSLCKAIDGSERVYHLAGQVAVTNSVANPRQDFEENALGTFNLLEGSRLFGNDPIVIYASTNKVYGGMEEVNIIEDEKGYKYQNLPFGVSERQPLDFHSPYGCSKGAGDQYTRDYFRIYRLKTVVMRQSCIYGYRQFGIEDQGWVAWFIIAALKGRNITIYGDGKQVRDILFIDDLLNAYEGAVNNIDKASGQIYNIGGGPENTISVWLDFGPLLEDLLDRPIPVSYSEWRAGDQKIYVSDIRKAKSELNWSPRMPAKEGISLLFKWISHNRHLFNHL